ncbi:MAG: hypothetical protein R2716_04865 [Microthrixaceae bacterium]
MGIRSSGDLRIADHRLSGRRHTPKTIIAGTVGNVMEWYDFALYGFFVPVLALFFRPRAPSGR